MANVFAVAGNMGDVVVESSKLAVRVVRVLNATTKETGELIIKEVTAANETWEKNKREELRKAKYSEKEIDQIIEKINNKMNALDL